MGDLMGEIFYSVQGKKNNVEIILLYIRATESKFDLEIVLTEQSHGCLESIILVKVTHYWRKNSCSPWTNRHSKHARRESEEDPDIAQVHKADPAPRNAGDHPKHKKHQWQRQGGQERTCQQSSRAGRHRRAPSRREAMGDGQPRQRLLGSPSWFWTSPQVSCGGLLGEAAVCPSTSVLAYRKSYK